MLNVINETIIDSIKLLPFLFLAFLIIEYTEHKLEKNNLFQKGSKKGPIVGSFLGIIPQCGFSVLATNLYVTRIISLGTLIAVYLTTSDEMLPIMIASHADITVILKILSLKLIIGIFFGILIDLFIKKDKESYHICAHEHCHCEESIIKSSLVHTFKTFIFIIIVTFILNISFYLIGEDTIKNLFTNNTIITPFLTALIGLIPNCAVSVLITELYLSNLLSLGSALAGLLASSGVALAVLFKTNKNIKENIKIILLLYLISSFVGLIINLI